MLSYKGSVVSYPCLLCVPGSGGLTETTPALDFRSKTGVKNEVQVLHELTV